MALAFSTVFGHYFAGLGMNRINLYGTLTGFAVTLAASWLLIPEYGINGAAMSVSLAYCIHAVYLFFIYKKHTKLIISELIPTREDLNFVWKELKLIIRKQD
jgi:O-antigen/teichoic acid export membrane protein